MSTVKTISLPREPLVLLKPCRVQHLEKILRFAGVMAYPPGWEETHKQSLTKNLKLARNCLEAKLVRAFAPLADGSHRRFDDWCLITALVALAGLLAAITLFSTINQSTASSALLLWSVCISSIVSFSSLTWLLYILSLDGRSVCDWICKPVTAETPGIPPAIQAMMKEIVCWASNRRVTGVEFELQTPSIKTVKDPIISVKRAKQAPGEVDERYPFAYW